MVHVHGNRIPKKKPFPIHLRKKIREFVTNFGPMGPKPRFYKVFVFRLLIWVGKKNCFHPKKTHVLRQGRGATTYITANVVEGPPGDIDWNQPWHTILHAWHRRIDQQLDGFKMWSTKYLSEYWKFANYVALLDDNRWVKRILHWNPGGEGLDAHFFNGNLHYKIFAAGITWAPDLTSPADLWFQYYADFILFVQA